MKEEKISFENHSQKISGILHTPEVSNSPAIIMCHGFTGNMHEHGLFINAAREFCKNGFTVLRFDFRGTNESEGRFRDMTVSGEVDDLKAAISYIIKQRINKDKIGVLGLSLGSIISVLGYEKRIKSMVLWSPASDGKKTFTDIFHKEVMDEIMDKGYYDLNKPSKNEWRTQTSFEVSKEFLEEAHKIKLADDIKSVKCPVLIVHGTEDDVVSYHDSEKLFESANEPKEIKIIKGADHTFHEEKHEKEVIKASLDWFNKYLK